MFAEHRTTLSRIVIAVSMPLAAQQAASAAGLASCRIKWQGLARMVWRLAASSSRLKRMARARALPVRASFPP